MARKRYGEDDILRLIREVEVHCNSGMDVVSVAARLAFRARPIMAGVEMWGINRARLTEMKTLEKENQRLKKIVADLELDKLILKESLDYLKPKA